MSEKETLDRAEYKKRKQESTDIKTFFTEDLVALERLQRIPVQDALRDGRRGGHLGNPP